MINAKEAQNIVHESMMCKVEDCIRKSASEGRYDIRILSSSISPAIKGELIRLGYAVLISGDSYIEISWYPKPVVKVQPTLDEVVEDILNDDIDDIVGVK
jgi:hypothetical protein